MIPDSFIQSLLARTDIVEVIERHLPLKKAGANYVACCPFHNEKTPSFSVSPSKQFYHCFGCSAHGSAIGFLMDFSGLDFVEAVKELAASLNLEVPFEKSHEGQRKPPAPSLIGLMAEAARFYKTQLKSSPKAIEYLKKRGLSGEIAARFGLGYAPEGWQNLEAVFPAEAAPALIECGLLIESEKGRPYARFRDRIMFPIQDTRSQVIAFGGRIIDQGEPKYLNSPETPLFVKGQELYGLPQARAAIRQENCVLVVEGYLDVVALAQHGIGNAVATLGTATTPTHVQKLLRQCDRLIFCFDGDAAGRKAASRALDACLEAVSDDKSASFLFLPAGEDPDSHVRQQGAERFRQQMAQALPLTDCLLQELRADKNLASAEGRAQLVHAARPRLRRLRAPLLRLQLVKLLAEESGFSVAEIESLCEIENAPTRRLAQRLPRQAPSTVSRKLLRLILQRPALAPRLPVSLIPADEAESAALAAVLTTLSADESAPAGFGLLMERFRHTLHEKLISETLAELVVGEYDEESVEAVFADAVEHLKQTGIRNEIDALNIKNKRTGLSADEIQRLQQLLTLKQAARPATST